MISLIIKSYLTILLSVALGAFFLIAGGLFIIFRLFASRAAVRPAVDSPASAAAVIKPAVVVPVLTAVEAGCQELSAIAGDDLVATQLDLARAYMEIDNHSAATTLLNMVCEQGSQSQREEAAQLLTHITDIQFVERVRKKSRK